MTVLRTAQPGDIITFGRYSQTADGTDQTPIPWRVLGNSGGELFLLSHYILDCKRYHAAFVEVPWRDCDLRKWLNDEFYTAAFDAAEQEVIKTTLCTDNGEGRPDTEDRVFLPSIAQIQDVTGLLGKEFRRAIGTPFARVKKADGCQLYVYDKSRAEDYVIENGEKHGCSWWWLRTQPGEPSRAAFIGTRASIRSYCRVNRVSYGVRPALILTLR